MRIYKKRESPISLGALEKLKTALENKGVKLAIIDETYFSGPTLSLASKNTCVVTGSSEKERFGLEDELATP